MQLDFTRWEPRARSAAWPTGAPFPHVVIDDAVTPPQLDALRDAVAHEPHWPERSELVDAMASAPSPSHPILAGFAAALGSADGLATIRMITGRQVARVEVRSYVYPLGGYLLPHTDGRREAGRQVAFALYLTPDGTCTGGELELFRCTTGDDGDIVATEPAGVVAHRPNRLVLFDVTEVSLHQVREVTQGARISLAGWFL